MKTGKLGGVAGGEGECGDDVAGWLVRKKDRVWIGVATVLWPLHRFNCQMTAQMTTTKFCLNSMFLLPICHCCRQVVDFD